jgi:hypothetical protein
VIKIGTKNQIDRYLRIEEVI